MPNLDEELLARQEEEESRREQMEAMAQQDRQQRREDLKAQKRAAYTNQQRQKLAKKALNQYGGKILGKAATRYGLRAIIMATWPWWGSALLIVLGICLILFVVISVPVLACNSSYTDGLSIAGLKLTIAAIPGDVCAAFNLGGSSGGGGASGTWTPPVPGAALDIVLTGAYRPGAITTGGVPSAHGRAEAIDVALRNPQLPFYSTDPRIGQAIAIAEVVGFSGNQGDVLDEYNYPQCNPSNSSCAGHIHMEFNTRANGTTYCDDTKVTSPPTDLVPIPSWIPRSSGVSNPVVRACMLPYVEDFFQQALALTVP